MNVAAKMLGLFPPMPTIVFVLSTSALFFFNHMPNVLTEDPPPQLATAEKVKQYNPT
jgi:hypothetical protein